MSKRTNTTSLELPPALRRMVERAAKAEDRNLGQQMRHWIRRGAAADGFDKEPEAAQAK